MSAHHGSRSRHDRGTGRAVAGLVATYGLPLTAEAQLQALQAALTDDPHAPTTIHDPLTVVRDHLADSLVALELRAVSAATQIADLGSGAGLPGLPLAIALPAANVTLVESSRRKCEFLEHARDVAGAVNATVVHARVEEWVGGRESCDLVTARALAPLAVVAEYAAPLLTISGALVAWRGRRDAADEDSAARAAAELGLEARPPQHVTPYPGALHRHLHVLVKSSPTPERFPRRPGMARKRPLGGI
jgi:16S rRNA (guanine527-N7)-methyltransferase